MGFKYGDDVFFLTEENDRKIRNVLVGKISFESSCYPERFESYYSREAMFKGGEVLGGLVISVRIGGLMYGSDQTNLKPFTIEGIGKSWEEIKEQPNDRKE